MSEPLPMSMFGNGVSTALRIEDPKSGSQECLFLRKKRACKQTKNVRYYDAVSSIDRFGQIKSSLSSGHIDKMLLLA